MAQKQMDDRTMMDDLLSSEKHITGTYNTFTNECSTQKIRDSFLNLLNEEHQMQSNIFDEMKKRSWYQTPAAEQNKVDTAKQKAQNQKPNA